MRNGNDVDIGLQDGEIVFYGKVPGKVKRFIRRKYREDKDFREKVIEKFNNKENGKQVK